MGGDKKDESGKEKGKKFLSGFLSGGATSMTQGSIDITKKLGEKSGAYTPAGEKKKQANEQMAQEQATIAGQVAEKEASDAETRQRMNIFKTSGGTDGEEIEGTAKKRRIFGN